LLKSQVSDPTETLERLVLAGNIRTQSYIANYL